MRHIMVMNAKGGCGKSTLATNIASYYADSGYGVALADYDPQRSSLDWLDRRPEDRAKIAAVAGFEDGLKHVPRSVDMVVIDAPARSHGKELTDLVYIDLPAVGRTVAAGEVFGEVESVKAVSDLYAPLAGEITAVNDALADDLAALSDDPFGAGWIVKLQVSDPAAADGLMDHAAYVNFCESAGH